jgi:hypothetical protein
MSSRREIIESVFAFDWDTLADFHRFRSSTDKQEFLKFLDSVVVHFQSISRAGLKVRHGKRRDFGGPISSDLNQSYDKDDSSQPDHISVRSSLNSWGNQSQRSLFSNQTTSTSCASQWTAISDLTATTTDSNCSAPLPMSRLQFRFHNRAIAANRKSWKSFDFYEPQYLNVDYFKETHQPFTPTYKFGLTSKLHVSLFKGIINDDKIDEMKIFIESVLDKNIKSKYLNQLRSLQTLRQRNHYETMHSTQFNLFEDHRIYKPIPSKPALTPYQLYASQVPLGDLAMKIKAIMEHRGDTQGETTQDAEESRTGYKYAPILEISGYAMSDISSDITEDTHVTLI